MQNKKSDKQRIAMRLSGGLRTGLNGDSGKTSDYRPASVSVIKRFAKASLLCAAFSATAATSMVNAQDSIAMVEHAAASVSGSQASPVAVAVVQSMDNDAVTSVSTATVQDSKSPITGLEPGTLALIGFGLLALAATRRNAR